MIRLGDIDDQDEEDPTKRREFGKAAALAFLPASRPAVNDDGMIAQALTSVTGSQRRLDATVRSRDLMGGVTAHLELAVRMHHQARSPEAPALAAAVSEAAGFAAWLSMDMLDLGSARTYYRQAVAAARRARMPLLAAYMTGSLAVFEIDAAADSLLGLAMIAMHGNSSIKNPPMARLRHGWNRSKRSRTPPSPTRTRQRPSAPSCAPSVRSTEQTSRRHGHGSTHSIM